MPTPSHFLRLSVASRTVGEAHARGIRVSPVYAARRERGKSGPAARGYPEFLRKIDSCIGPTMQCIQRRKGRVMTKETRTPGAVWPSVAELQFIAEAVRHYCATRCPLQNETSMCPMVTWTESVHTGAIERVCGQEPNSWAGRLARQPAPRLSPH